MKSRKGGFHGENGSENVFAPINSWNGLSTCQLYTVVGFIYIYITNFG